MSTPPLLAAEPSPAAKSPSAELRAVVITVALLQLFLVFYLSGQGRRADDLPYRIGTILGTTVIWPLLIIGLFSLAPRFRTPRRRAIILLVMWSLFLLSHVGNLMTRLRRPSLARPAERTTVQQVQALFGERAAEPPAVETPAARVDAPPTLAAAPLDFDFSPGSDERLRKQIEHAQEERYQAIVAAYAKALAVRPHDVVLALERVKFIEHFAHAEDVTIASAADDLETAAAHLTTRFPNAPETALYELDKAYGPEFEEKANHHALLLHRWPKKARAQFFLLRANAATIDGRTTRAEQYAARSFEAEASVEAALILAEAAKDAKKHSECLRLLGHAVFDSAEPWAKKRKMDLLFAIKETARAVALYDEIAEPAAGLLNDAETAVRLAEAGRVEAARSILAKQEMTEWNRERLGRSRLEFELKFGNAEQAHEAYREMRKSGLRSDPVLRDRLALFWAHPGLAWNFDDALGVVLLGLLLLLAFATPLVVLVPVHYWSLVRARAAQPGAMPDAQWGLRQAWLALGALLLADVASTWLFRPAAMRTWWNDFARESALDDQALLAQNALVWTALGITLLVLLWRRQAWRLVRTSRWSFGKTIGAAFGVTLLLRVGLLIYALVWPEALLGEVASLSAETQQLCRALHQSYGALGLISVIAVLVPILEEILFRGVLLQAFAKHIPFGWANTAQAILFAAVHENLRLFPFFFAFGVVCGWLARRSGGLLPAMAMHACNNLLACAVVIRAGGA